MAVAEYPGEPVKPAHYNGDWLAIAWAATKSSADLRMQGELTDENVLQFAASLQAQLGNTNQKIFVSTSVNGHGSGWYTLAQINGWVVSAAAGSGASAQQRTQAAQAVFGRAQTVLSQWVSDAGAFVSAENNKATTADPQNVQQMLQVLSTFNQFLTQIASLNIQ